MSGDGNAKARPLAQITENVYSCGMRTDALSALAGLLALLIGLVLVALLGRPLFVEYGLLGPAAPIPLPSPGKLSLAGVAALALFIFAAKFGAVSRVQGLTSGMKGPSSTSLSMFMRRIAAAHVASVARGPAPAPSRSMNPPCELCGRQGALTGLPAPLTPDPVRVCRGCAPRFAGGRIDWAALTPHELGNVWDDARLARQAGREDGLLGLAHLFEGRRIAASLLERPPFTEPVTAARLAHALEAVGAYPEALELVKRQPIPSREDFLLLLRLHRRLGTLAQTTPEDVPAALLPDLAEACLEGGDVERAKAALTKVPRAEWKRREYGLALRLAGQAGDFRAAEAVFTAAADAFPPARAPEVHYAFALLCERAGALDRARRIYACLGPFRDAPDRLKSLGLVSAEEAAAVSALPAASAAATPVPGASAFVSAGTLLHQRYRIRKTLGRGGMGFVFMAQDLKRGRLVAVKRIASVLTALPAFRDALIQEATAAWHLPVHESIAKLHKIVSYGDRLDLVVEYVEGETLSDLLAARGRFFPAECASFARALVAALAWAHSHGVLHRDLKPGNVMQSRDGRTKVLDFGVARGYGAGTDGTAGNPEYMAPERHAGRATAGSDLYSLGVTLYELLNGARPFTGADMLARKRAESYAPLPEGTPESMRRAVAACLRADPEARPKDAAAVAALLGGAG